MSKKQKKDGLKKVSFWISKGTGFAAYSDNGKIKAIRIGEVNPNCALIRDAKKPITSI